MTLFRVLEQAAVSSADRVFLRGCADTTPADVTYAEALARSTGLARGLSDLGIGTGDRLAVELPNRVEFVYLWLAASAIGAVVVPIDPRLTDFEVSALLAHSSPALMVAPRSRGHLAGAIPIMVWSDSDADDQGASLASLCARDDRPIRSVTDTDQPFALLYTSGSTGRPKACVLGQESFLLPTASFVDRLALTPADVFFHVLPLHHMAGLSFLTSALCLGASVALRPRFSGSRFWQDVRETRATVFRHLGEMLVILCAQPADADDRDHALRIVYGGGASTDTATRFRERFGPLVVEGYGMSETNTTLCNSVGDNQVGTLGMPLPHVRTRIVDANGQPMVGPGRGELEIRRNPAMMAGYLDAPDLTNSVFHGDWFRTGDLVDRDHQNRLRFAGRAKEIIRRRGENIDPTEIERAIESCAGVRRAAVIAVPRGPHGDLELHAFAQPLAGAEVDDAAIMATCRRRLAPFKRPHLVRLLAELPMTSTVKVNKMALRALTANRTQDCRDAKDGRRDEG